MTPDLVFLTRGLGVHRERLTSFELALRDAGIQAQNIVAVSSIFPPNARLATREEGQSLLQPGQLLYCVMARQETDEAGRHIAASIGLALPPDRSTYGYLSEHHSFGEGEEKAGDYAESLAAEMLATKLGLPFEPDRNWNEKRKLWELSGQVIRTTNITQAAEGQEGRWTTVLAAACLVFSGKESG